ncbi:MAG: DUF1338 domain-containing protein [Bacteroidota bacterium]
MTKNDNVLEGFLTRLMDTYKARVPAVEQITTAMVDQGLINHIDDIENDHIAFRTMGVPHLGIKSLEKIFLAHGYQRRDHMYFAHKKLNAFWYSPPVDRFPRIFISELIVDEMPEFAREIIFQYTSQVSGDPVKSLDLQDVDQIAEFLHGPLWTLPTLPHYKMLSEISEYAAWVIYNRYYLNHYTISVHNLPFGYNTMDQFVDFVKSLGIELNQSGGEIKVSADGLLRQSSTMAGLAEATFADGESISVPTSYVEFAERRIKPEFAHLEGTDISRTHRRDGFEVGNADKIFESTYTKAS